MPEDPQPLDVAKFRLDAYKTSVEMHVKLIKAYADYNFRMMEVLEKRVEIETNILKMRMLQDAFADFRLARRNNIRHVRTLDEKLERYSTSVDRTAYLLRGETARQSLVGLGWRGFWYLVSQSPVATVLELGKPKCRASDRKGKNYFRPAPVEMAMPDAPSDIRNSLLLMDWARKLQAVPRLGSPPLEKFAELLEILGDGAKSLVTELKAELKTAETELRKLREANWKTMNLQNKEPKN